MSEPALAPVADPMPPQGAAAPLTSGAMLRQAREALGLHIAALAVSLKVPVKKLEALEADRFDLLPDTFFARALTSSVCRSLKIDPAPILEKLPKTAAPQWKAYESGAKVPFQSSGGHSHGLIGEQLAKPMVWVVAALLAGALALFFFPFERHAEVMASIKPVAGAVPSAPAASSPGAATAAETALASPALPPASAAPVEPAQMVAGSGAATGAVVFKAQALSWVEVVDASGVVQVRKNIAAGEVVGASGVLPLSVVVGRADTTAVEVHGKPYDVLAIAKDNVARFEVKQ